MMFNKVVVQNEAVDVLNDLKIDYECYDNNYYVVDAIESASGLIYNAVKAGVSIFNLINVEDVMIRDDRIDGSCYKLDSR